MPTYKIRAKIEKLITSKLRNIEIAGFRSIDKTSVASTLTDDILTALHQAVDCIFDHDHSKGGCEYHD